MGYSLQMLNAVNDNKGFVLWWYLAQTIRELQQQLLRHGINARISKPIVVSWLSTFQQRCNALRRLQPRYSSYFLSLNAPFREDWTRMSQVLSQSGVQHSFHFERRWLSPRMEWFYNGQPREIKMAPFNLEQLGIAFIMLPGGLALGSVAMLSEMVCYNYDMIVVRMSGLYLQLRNIIQSCWYLTVTRISFARELVAVFIKRVVLYTKMKACRLP